MTIPELGDVVVFAIDTSHINNLMLDGMMDCLTAAKRARWTNVVTRKDGTERTWEADWLKHLQRLSPEAVQARASLPASPSQGQWVQELLRRARGYVAEASTRYYDGTDGASLRQSARGLLAHIDEALAAPSQPSQGDA